MEPSFWRERWERNDTRWHQSEPNRLLIEHCTALSLSPNSRVFVPLCGKSLDLGWLRSHQYHVYGVELSEIAITQVFAELGLSPTVTAHGPVTGYRAEKLTLFLGDLFELSHEQLEPIDAIYDRAALVALPESTRVRYATHLATITARAPQLLLTYEYDQSKLEGPPFSVGGDELQRLYGRWYDLTLLAKIPVEGGLKGHRATEQVWLVKPRLITTA